MEISNFETKTLGDEFKVALVKLIKEDVKFRSDLKKLLFPGKAEDLVSLNRCTSPSVGQNVTVDVNNEIVNPYENQNNDEESKSEILEIKEEGSDENSDTIIIIESFRQ
jgi:hypothetical protein